MSPNHSHREFATPRRHPLRRGLPGNAAQQKRSSHARRGAPLGRYGYWNGRVPIAPPANDNRASLTTRIARLFTTAGLAALFGAVVMLFDA